MKANADLTSAFIIKIAISVTFFSVIDQVAIAQIVPDRTLSSPSLVRNSGSTATITGGTTAGTNLFHSFSEFSIPSGATAFFNNNQAISNIITRVTGGDYSLINGLVKANGTANLFLINPNGILFGPDASLNIGGSFLASTANGFTFADGLQYSAINPQTAPLLAVNVPVGLQYGKAVQPIATIGSSLRVKRGQTLALVGGDVSLDTTTLLSPSGRIELGGLSDSGTVGLTFNGNIPSLNFSSTDSFRSNVSLTKSTLGVSGIGRGDIAINAQNIDFSTSVLLAGILSDTEIKAGNITLFASDQIKIANTLIYNLVSDEATGRGGDVEVTAKSLALTEKAKIGTWLLGKGKAGDINIAVDSLSLTNGAQLQTLNAGIGNVGNINVTALDTITLNGADDQGESSGILSKVEGNAQGNGGDISISTRSLMLKNESTISSATTVGGNAGNLTIAAKDLVVLDSGTSFIFSGSVASGNTGDISISTNTLKLDNGGSISNITQGQGNTGDISISTNTLKLNNGGSISNVTLGQGNAGSIAIAAADTIDLVGTDSSLSTITIFTGSESTGNGGDITISARVLNLYNRAPIFTATLGQGNAGSISIAADSIDLNEIGSTITIYTDPKSSGNGGDINIFTRQLSLTNGGLIKSGSLGKGITGDIIITALDFIHLDGVGLIVDDIAAPRFVGGIYNYPDVVVAGGEGGAGNIILTTGSLRLKDGAVIYAIQSGSRRTGNIDITATESVNISGAKQLDTPSRIASATLVDLPGGDITINTPILNILGQDVEGLDRTGVTATSRGTGNAGNIAINAGTVTVDGGEIAAIMEDRAIGDGGSITITANTLTALNGGNVRTSTLSTRGGDAGDIAFFLSDSLNLSGHGSGIFANTGINSTGNGGNIIIDPPTVNISDGAAISVDSQGSGTGGSIGLQAGNLTLDNGTISAATASNNGGNVNLAIKGLLLANNDSTISATAGGSGNGGNLDINAGFLVLNNSDITANAFQGQGGNIAITTQGIFQSRDSTITASSDLGINGAVQLNVTDLDPSRGLFSLPETVVDSSGLVTQKCDATVSKASQQSEFVITGKGGLQPNPSESLQDESILSDWVTLQPRSNKSSKQPSVTIAPPNRGNDGIAIAQGWKVDPDGTVVLTAEPSTINATPTWQPLVKCRA